MHTEIELKLTAKTQTLPQIKQHHLFNACNWTEQILESTYFDDDNLTLADLKMALRIRRLEDKLIQTLKISHLNEHGLSNRSEFDTVLPNFKLDLTAIKSHLPANIGKLNPLFITIFTRSKCEIDFAASRIEVALDSGEVKLYDDFGTLNSAKYQQIKSTNSIISTLICEVELELINGKSKDLVALADKLSAEFELHKNDISKAQQGFNLLTKVKF